MVNEKTNEDNMFDNVDVEVSNQNNNGQNQINEENPNVFNPENLNKVVYKKLERENLDGKTVTITKAEILLPRIHDRDGNDLVQTAKENKKVKYYNSRLVVHFDYNDQQESIPGIKYFVDAKTNLPQQYPAIPRNGRSQAAKLFNMVAQKMGKNPEDVTDFQFISFLNTGTVKAKITWDTEYDTPVNRIAELV